jgi:glycerol-1-phosphate dehydrogenase [NAD(P)+]
LTPIKFKDLESFEIPRYVVFGPGAIGKVPHVLEKLGFRNLRGLIITGPTYSNRLVSKVECDECDVEIVGNAEAEYLLDLPRKYMGGIDYVVGLGGGRVIDVGKVVSSILNIPYVSIPTTASHDGFASPFISHMLQLDLNKLGLGKVHRAPIAIVADTSIILEAPPRYLRAGIGELVGKLIAVRDWALASRLKGEEFSEYAATLATISAEMILKNAPRLMVHDEGAVRLVVKSLVGCGVAMSIAGSSRPCSGSEHLFSHALDMLARELGFTPALHGEQVAVGAVLMAYLHGMRWRRIKEFLSKLNIPTTAKELGMDKDIIVNALVMAHEVRPDRYTILGSDGLSRKAAENLVEETGVA